jgi:glucose-1-phosphate thymidylyltransferase
LRVVVPSAGYGTRLRPHTYSKPKPLVSVAGRPVLDHVMESMRRLDVEEYIFIVGYLGDQIEAHLHKHYDVPVTFVEQKELLGQAHALALAGEHIRGPVLILFIDTLFDADLSMLERSEDDAVLFVKRVEDPRRFGVVEVGDDGYVTRLIEKPDTMENDLAVIGAYYIRDGEWLMRSVDALLSRKQMTKGEYYLADAMQIMIDEGARFRPELVTMWEDCGKADTLLQTNRYLLDHGRDPTGQGDTATSVIVPPVYIAPTARIEHSVVGPHVSVGEDCVVRNAIVRNSILDRGATVQDIVLDSSIIGSQAIVQDGSRQLNIGDASEVHFDSNHHEA